MDYLDNLIGKVPHQIEIQIRTGIRPDSKTYRDQHITLFTNGRWYNNKVSL